jgi:TetR/AcrR family transcriptional regulator, regulator of cefoperazone and chloramphenicol sensitivity
MDAANDQLPLRPADLSTYARIRNAALQGFAADGIAGTSIRDVASAAGVSPGLVQHHFGTKARLRDAVNEYVLAVAAETFQNLVDEDGDSADVWAFMGDTVTAWVRDNVLALRYLGRALVEGDAEAARIFDALVGIARANWLGPLDRSGALRSNVDQEWAAIHAVVFNLASVLIEPAISRHLPEPFFSPQQLQRWNEATTDLYRRGVSQPAPDDTVVL